MEETKQTNNVIEGIKEKRKITVNDFNGNSKNYPYKIVDCRGNTLIKSVKFLSIFLLIIVLCFMVNNDKFKSELYCGNTSVNVAPVIIPACPTSPKCPNQICECNPPTINFPDDITLNMGNSSLI